MAQIVRVDGVESLRRKYGQLGDEVFPSALARAVNRVSNTVKSRSAKDIAEATGLKQSSVRRRIVFRRRATKSNPSAALEISGQPFNLVEFVSGSKEPRSPRGGVTANAWGRRRKYPGVFLARMPNGQVIAVQRSRAGRGRRSAVARASARFAGRGGVKLTRRGSPHIEAVFGAGIAREAANPVLTEQRQQTMRERLPIEIEHEVSFAVKRLAARSGRALRRARR